MTSQPKTNVRFPPLSDLELVAVLLNERRGPVRADVEQGHSAASQISADLLVDPTPPFVLAKRNALSLSDADAMLLPEALDERYPAVPVVGMGASLDCRVSAFYPLRPLTAYSRHSHFNPTQAAVVPPQSTLWVISESNY